MRDEREYRRIVLRCGSQSRANGELPHSRQVKAESLVPCPVRDKILVEIIRPPCTLSRRDKIYFFAYNVSNGFYQYHVPTGLWWAGDSRFYQYFVLLGTKKE